MTGGVFCFVLFCFIFLVQNRMDYDALLYERMFGWLNHHPYYTCIYLRICCFAIESECLPGGPILEEYVQGFHYQERL